MSTLIALTLALAAAISPSPTTVSATLDGTATSVTLAATHHCWIPSADRLACYSDPRARDAAAGLGTAGTSATTYATLYESAYYAGASLVVSASVASLGTYGWNDRASSLTVPSGHSVTLFLDASYAGASNTFTNSAATLGAFDNAASSIRVNY